MKKNIIHVPLWGAIILSVIIITAGIFMTASSRFAHAAGKTLPDSSLMSAHFLDIPYASKSAAQKLDIYLPKQGEKPYPVILHIHGDGRRVSSKRDQIAAYANPVLEKGYALVSIDYRYSSEAIFTARIYDAKTAVRYIKAEAGTYDLNPNRIIAWGESTGATLAALLAVSGDVVALEDLSLGNPKQSSRIYGAVMWSGVFNFMEVNGRRTKAHSPGATESKMAALLNPETYITVDDPPFLIQHGTKDTRTPVQQSIDFAAKLEKVLGSEMVFLDLLEGAAHQDAAFFSPKNVKKVLTFFDTWTD